MEFGTSLLWKPQTVPPVRELARRIAAHGGRNRRRKVLEIYGLTDGLAFFPPPIPRALGRATLLKIN
jgi:hypothetical protein